MLSNDLIFLTLTIAILAFVVVATIRPLFRNDAPENNDLTGRLATLRVQYQEAIDEEERQRLLVTLSELEKRQVATTKPTNGRLLALLLVVAIPLASFATYMAVGRPDLAMFDPEDSISPEAREMIAMAEEKLSENPDDANGWAALGQTYLNTGQPEKAIEALGKAVKLEPSDEHRLSLAEARFTSAGLTRDDEAMALLADLFKSQPNNPRIRFYLGLQAVRDRKMGAAKALLRDMFAPANMMEPWYAGTKARLEAELSRMGATLADLNIDAPSGPNQADVAAANEMSEEDRQAMIEGMVAGLAAQLEQNPQDVRGWVRLIRSYDVLNRKKEFLDAIDRAMAANPESIQILILKAASEKRDGNGLTQPTREKLLKIQKTSDDEELLQVLDQLLS